MLQTWCQRVRRLKGLEFYPSLNPRRMALLVLAVAPSCNALGDVNLFSLENDRQLGEEAYPEVLAGEQIVHGGTTLQMVTGLMERLVAAARQEHQHIVDRFTWEVRLIDDDTTVNAFALPGGKMAVYTGILPVAQTEEGLAVVMGHEIAHVIHRHGTEAMTRMYGVELLIDILVEGDAAELSRLGASLVHLKFGRNAELEADAMGLRFMALAGYDPRVAADFWTRMAKLGGSGQPEWLSTHPSHENRIEQIRQMLPTVIPIYEANRE